MLFPQQKSVVCGTLTALFYPFESVQQISCFSEHRWGYPFGKSELFAEKGIVAWAILPRNQDFVLKHGFCGCSRYSKHLTVIRTRMDKNEKRRQPLQDFPLWGCFFEVAAAAALFEVLEYIVQRMIKRCSQAFFHDPHYLCFKD